MGTDRTRSIVSGDSVPELPGHVHLRFDKLREKWVVLAPEKVLWPDDISADILGRCSGTSSVTEIVSGLSKDYNAPPDQIMPDVVAFLQEWSDRLLVRCDNSRVVSP
ncbi:pyrroloquinoline quinone biosynthesis peptide chaperone PqqD [Roseibium sp.]|uniref:pyrroloquinoline quinone biosynthesis peptide chaperone PqqD n=1 Tax=Roseibium sp. TaxID=1936156 RepID=UPI003A9760DC